MASDMASDASHSSILQMDAHQWRHEAKSMITALAIKYSQFKNKQEKHDTTETTNSLIEIAGKILGIRASKEMEKYDKLLVEILFEQIRLLVSIKATRTFGKIVMLSSVLYPNSPASVKLMHFISVQVDNRLFGTTAGRQSYYEGLLDSQVRCHADDTLRYYSVLLNHMVAHDKHIPLQCMHAIFTPLTRGPLSHAAYAQPLLRPWASLALTQQVEASIEYGLVSCMISNIRKWIEFNDWDSNLLARTFRFIDEQRPTTTTHHDATEDAKNHDTMALMYEEWLWFKFDLFVCLTGGQAKVSRLLSPWWNVRAGQVIEEINQHCQNVGKGTITKAKEEEAEPEAEAKDVIITYKGKIFADPVIQDLNTARLQYTGNARSQELIAAGASSQLSKAIHSAHVICSQCFRNIDDVDDAVKVEAAKVAPSSHKVSEKEKQKKKRKNKHKKKTKKKIINNNNNNNNNKCKYCRQHYCQRCLSTHIVVNPVHKDGYQLLLDPLCLPYPLETICTHQLILHSNKFAHLPPHLAPRYVDWFSVSRLFGICEHNTDID